MAPRIQTVTGDMEPKDLGITLTHEHLAMEISHFYRKPPTIIKDKFDTFDIYNAGYIRQYPYSIRSNLVLNDYHAKTCVERDLIMFSQVGGGAIVENTTHGLARDVQFYKQLSKSVGIYIIAGTGYYIEDTQPSENLYKTVEDLYNDMQAELVVGCQEDKDVKAGFMGELASVWPMRDFERRVVKAAGESQKEIGCGVSFNPHRDEEAPFEIIRLYLEAGGTASKAVMSHLDRTLKGDKLLEFAQLGTYCQFDLFGTEVSHYQLNPGFDMPSDAQRIDLMATLLAEGKEDRMLMSHDIHTKHRLVIILGQNFERRVVKAAGESQKEIGCGVSFNPHRDEEAPFEIIRLYLEAGGTASKAVMSHLDRTLKGDKLLEFAQLGTYCQFDLFGTEVSHYQLNPGFDMPSDAQRIDLMATLLAEGKEDRMLMSHDIHTKHRLSTYGGHGYSHIITNVLPKMKHKGFSQDAIDKITVTNPATWLTIDN